MTSRDFCYWLQGYFEIQQSSKDGLRVNLDSGQVDVIRRHLALVFKHEIDPSYGSDEHNAHLQQIHGAPADLVFKC